MTGIAAAAFVTTVANALERMAFVIVEPAGCSARSALEGCSYHACVGLQHDGGEGVVLVAATFGFLQEFIAGMLGTDAGAIDLDEHGEVAVMELANVLGGEAVMAIGGPESPLRLQLPQAIAAGSGTAMLQRIEAATDNFACVLASERGRIVVAGCLH